MGLMDKAKEAAEKAKASAQHMAQQGQAKVAAVQQGRSEAELQKALGDAYFNEQRRGGDHEAVVLALVALDEHYVAAAAAPAGPDAGVAAPPTGAPMAAPPPAPPAAPPAGNFTIDDM
ncbi:MAG: hypothetical protein QOG01_1743 [Pseudonocardiales bacterium]|jgi:hypothetical protein|nr:hypothetical protein [Pseudonocardiales bacterium]